MNSALANSFPALVTKISVNEAHPQPRNVLFSNVSSINHNDEPGDLSESKTHSMAQEAIDNFPAASISALLPLKHEEAEFSHAKLAEPSRLTRWKSRSRSETSADDFIHCPWPPLPSSLPAAEESNPRPERRSSFQQQRSEPLGFQNVDGREAGARSMKTRMDSPRWTRLRTPSPSIGPRQEPQELDSATDVNGKRSGQEQATVMLHRGGNGIGRV